MRPDSPTPLFQIYQYEILEKIGEGTAGCVYKAVHTPTKDIVALKVLKSWSQDKSARDEVALLQHLPALPNVIQLREVCPAQALAPASPASDSSSPTGSEDSMAIVFPYLEHDLSGLLSEHAMSLPQVKCYLRQLLTGLAALHEHGCMHRDIKAANLLLNNRGELLIADLGTATSYRDRSTFSHQVVTLWYRAPELLFGESKYGPEVDMWSVGCVFIELLTSRNFLPGPHEAAQIECISKLCGTPDEFTFPGVSKLPLYDTYRRVLSPASPPHSPTPSAYPRRLREKLRQAGYRFPADALDLLDGFLTIDPKRRMTAEQALRHPFFANEPAPLHPSSMPTYESVHVLDATRRKMAEKQAASNGDSDHPSKKARPATQPPTSQPSSSHHMPYSHNTHRNSHSSSQISPPSQYSRYGSPNPYGTSPHHGSPQWSSSPNSSPYIRHSSPEHVQHYSSHSRGSSPAYYSPSHQHTSPQSSPTHYPQSQRQASYSRHHHNRDQYNNGRATSRSTGLPPSRAFVPASGADHDTPALTTVPKPTAPAAPATRKRRVPSEITLPTDLYLRGFWDTEAAKTSSTPAPSPAAASSQSSSPLPTPPAPEVVGSPGQVEASAPAKMNPYLLPPKRLAAARPPISCDPVANAIFTNATITFVTL
eukprot:TRINITY_DN1780_c0_g1_i3.p1 TRINITY_DN1780_c0_g1~~TRINITY_DN1780_c0_g1_i3.p1  ORF type:complete len:651 (-),score=90.76 TRINITY_DN1780_c0_g1_i3:103-2055(-)